MESHASKDSPTPCPFKQHLKKKISSHKSSPQQQINQEKFLHLYLKDNHANHDGSNAREPNTIVQKKRAEGSEDIFNLIGRETTGGVSIIKGSPRREDETYDKQPPKEGRSSEKASGGKGGFTGSANARTLIIAHSYKRIGGKSPGGELKRNDG